MNIITDPVFYTKEFADRVARIYNATYICETTIRSKNDQWLYNPSLLYYNTMPHPEGSNYFAITRDGDNYIISDAITITLYPIRATKAKNGDIIYSHYRHHMNTSTDGTVWCDGGREYYRGSVSPTVLLQFVKDRLEIVSEE
jgi:hypothetical protein